MKVSFPSFASVAFFLVLSSLVDADVPAWGQCGGQGYSGETICASNSLCVVTNQYYAQCIPGSSGDTTTSTSSSTSSTTSSEAQPTAPGTCSENRTKFTYFGVNESGAEFGQSAVPGTLGIDYVFPAPSSIDYFLSQGLNTFRVPFLMERLSPPANGLTGAFDETYLSGLNTIINYITDKGAFAIIDPHNFMRYNGQVITSASDFQTWWENLAGCFKTNNNVIFDVMNEPHDIDASTVFTLNQAAINGIRASGATTQLILVEGTAWTGAWSWTTSGNSEVFANIIDPYYNTAIQMHQYLDADSSGMSSTCVSPTIGAERLQAATAWLKAHNLKGFLGEMGGGSDDVCVSAVYGAICALQESGVWIGFTWWAAGPWWAQYFQSMEPPNGAAISRILPEALNPFI